MKKIDAIIEFIKIAGSVYVLYLFFIKADIVEDVVSSMGFVAKAYFLVIVPYIAGRQFAFHGNTRWSSYLLFFYVATILSVLAGASLGGHVEDADPLFGGGDYILDREVTWKERGSFSIRIFLPVLVSAIAGVRKERSDVKNIGKNFSVYN